MGTWQGFYNELATTRYPALLAYSTLLTGSRAAGEDLLHDAFIRVFSRARRFDTARHAEAYVRRTLANLAMDRSKSRAREAAIAKRAHEVHVGRDHAAAIDDRLAVASALERLPQRVRVCVVLRYYDDLTVTEIANRLGLATGTVKRYLSDARVALGELVDQPDEDLETVAVTVSERKRP